MELFTYLMAKNDHNTSVNKDLFSYLLGKNQSGTYTDYSGTSLSINNTKKGKMKVNLLGNTSQTGTPTPSSPIPVNVVSGDNTIVSTGKNLFDKNNETYTTGYITGSGATSLSPSSYNRTLYIHCQPNTTYTIQKMVSVSSSRFFIASSVDIPSAGVSIYNVLNGGDNNTSATYTTSNNAKYLLVNYMATNTTTTTIEEMLNSIQIEVGSTATTYEPYTSTSYPIHLGEYELCKISTYQDRFIRTTGKNLFDVSTSTPKKYVRKSDGTIQNSNDWSATDYIEVKPNQSYIYSGITNGASGNAGTSFYDETKTFISSINSTEQTFTTPSNAKYVRISLNTETPTSVMFNEGETALPYEPYGTNEWYLEKKIGKKVLNGNFADAGQTNVFYTTEITDYATSNNIPLSQYYNGVSNVSGSSGMNSQANNTIAFINISGGTTPRFYVKDTRYSSHTGLNTWLGTNNLIVYYILATPTYTPITGTLKDELEAVWRANSYNGTTNISQVNNDLPFNMDVSVKVGS